MLIQPTLATLRSLKLSCLVQACQQQLEQPHLQQLAFDERFALIVEAERAYREAVCLTRLLRNAHFRQCRQGLRLQYEHTPRLLETLRLARSEGTYNKRLAQLARLELLILDDLGLQTLQVYERHDLLEVIEDRYQLHGTINTSPLPPATWHAYLEYPTVADALLDRLFHRAYRIELKGTSLRKKGDGDLRKMKG